MPLSIGLSEHWQEVRQGHVGIMNTWRKLRNAHIGIDGVWKPLWSYGWATGDWSQCSATCGGGTQTRTVTCQRNDGQNVEGTFCDAVSKPASSQECNTQGCTECRYTEGTTSESVNMVMSWVGLGTNDSVFIWDGLTVSPVDTPFEATEVYANGYRYYKGTLQSSSDNEWMKVENYQICRSPA